MFPLLPLGKSSGVEILGWNSDIVRAARAAGSTPVRSLGFSEVESVLEFEATVSSCFRAVTGDMGEEGAALWAVECVSDKTTQDCRLAWINVVNGRYLHSSVLQLYVTQASNSGDTRISIKPIWESNYHYRI